jgi:type VI secretion system protein ImpF
MSANRLEPNARQSLLDRLVDTEPQLAADPPLSWSESVARLRAAVLRELGWLLNTRRTPEPAPAHSHPELQSSLYHYGLADVSSLGSDATETRQRLVRQLEECIRTFEPRLTGVRVVPRAEGGDATHRIPFVVEGLLRTEPHPERVEFDTVLEVTSGEFRVEGDRNA